MRHSAIKPVDDVEFDERKLLREGNNEKMDNFEIEILDEGALDKALEGPEKKLDGEKPWKTIYEVINNK